MRTIHQPDYGLDAAKLLMRSNIMYSKRLFGAPKPNPMDAGHFMFRSSVLNVAHDLVDDHHSYDADVSDDSHYSTSEIHLAIEMLATRIYLAANNVSVTVEELQDLVELIQRFVDDVCASGQISLKSGRRLKRLLARCTTALTKGDVETVRTRLRKIADDIAGATPKVV